MTFEAYALTLADVARGSRALALRAEIGDLTGKGAKERHGWAQIAKVGEWRGHPSGAFQIEAEHLAAVVADFESRETPVAFDYEHASTIEGVEAPASGWVKDLEIRGEELWAFVEWTEKAANYIRGGEYRFTSSVLLFEAPHRETGKPQSCRLHSVALTNTPFMDGLSAVALSDGAVKRATSRALREIPKADVISAIESTGSASLTTAALHKLIDDLGANSNSEVRANTTEVTDMTVEQGKPVANADVGDPAAAIAARLMEASGLAAEELAAAIEANLDAILAALKGAESEEAEETEEAAAEGEALMAAKNAVDAATIKALSDRIAVYEKRDADAARAALLAEVDSVMTEKRLDPSLRESMVVLAEKDPQHFRTVAKGLPAAYPKGAEASAIAGGRTGEDAITREPRYVALADSLKRRGLKDPAVIDKYVRAELAKTGV